MADQRARLLRANATKAERHFWRGPRILKVKGLHFRRQAPIGRYYVDFVCHSAKVVIELDGSQHKEPSAIAYDNQRTDFLRSRGYNVLRFWNGDVMRNREGILEAILAAATDPPTRNLLARSAVSLGRLRQRARKFRPPREGEVLWFRRYAQNHPLNFLKPRRKG